MASIQKRGKKHAVVYTYTDQEGQKRQKWETFNTKAEARKRKSAVEAELDNGTFIPPNTTTVESFLNEFVELYGEKRWGLSIYASNTALINNYINPLIGNLVVQDINKRTVDKYIQQLQKTAPVNTPYRHAKTEYVTPCTIEKIIKLLRCAFHQAVRWDMIGKNPFEDADLPKREKKVRAIWTADIIRQALDSCQDGKLYIAINLAFACSMRMGEITGLTWDCLHIADEDIANDNAYVWIEKELTRVDQRAIDALGEKDILFVFPRLMGGKSSTRLVLKKPKTESSIRKVWLPKTLAIGGTPYSWILSSDLPPLNFADFNSVLLTILGVCASGSVALIALILLLILAWNYIKLLFEAAERYILLGVIVYTAPMAFATGASQSTSNIFKSWCRMFGGQIFLLMMNAWCLRLFTSMVGSFLSNPLSL